MYHKLQSQFNRLYTIRVSLIKYLLVGGGAFILDFGTFFSLTNLFDMGIYLANLIALMVGFISSYLGNRLLVFSGSRKDAAHTTFVQVLMYALLVGINSVLTYIIINFVANDIGYSHEIGKIVSMFFILIWNFIIYKKIIFKSKI